MAYFDNAYNKSYFGGDQMAASLGEPGAASMASSAAPAASGAMMAGGPRGAAIGVGGSFLSNYLAQKAADERQRRAQAMQIQSEYAQNQNKGFDTMNQAFRGALR